MSTPLDELATRAAATLDGAAQQRVDGLSFDGLRQRRRARQRRRGTAVMAVALVLVVAVAVAVRPEVDRTTLLERPYTSEAPLPLPGVDGSEPPAAGTGSHDDVLIVDDGLESVTIIDPAAGLAFRRTAEGQRPGDQPHRLIRSGDRLVVGWGQITSTSLTGEDPVELGDATIAVPAWEDGMVWLVTYASGRIDGGEQQIDLVDVATGEVQASGTLPGGTNILAGIPAGLALTGADGIDVWSTAGGEVTHTLESTPAAFVGDASLTHLAACGGDCEVLHVTRISDDTTIAVDAPPELVFDGSAARFAPDGRTLAVPVRPARPIEQDDVALLALIEVATGDLTVIEPPDGAGSDRLLWSVDGESVYSIPFLPPEGDGVLVITDAASGVPTTVPLPTGARGSAVAAERHEIPELNDLPAEVPACDGRPGPEPCRYTDALIDLAGDSTETEPTVREAGWHALPAAPLAAAFGAAAAWTGQEFVVWGGYAGGGTPEEQAVADAAAYDPAADRWRELDDAPIPGAYEGEAFWTGDEVWVLGGFGGRAGHDSMRGAAAYDPETDRWRVLPELPAPAGAAAWLHTAAVVITADGALWILGPEDQAWVQAASPSIDPPFRATGGDGALLVVTDDRLHTLTAVDGDTVREEPREDLLGLSATAQEQRADVAATMVDDGDPSIDTLSSVLIGETGTIVSTLGVSLHWRMQDPPTARNVRALHVADERRVVAEDGVTSGHLELLDVASGGWEPLATPPHDPGHGPATAAGGGMLFTWGGGSLENLPHDQGALLILPPASPRSWPSDRAPGAPESFASTPVPLGLPDDLDPDPGPLPPLIAPGGVWSARTTVEDTAVLAQTPYEGTPSRAVPLPGPPLTSLALGQVVWAAGPDPSGGIRLVQATYQEVVPHVGTLTLPFQQSPDRSLRLATVDGAVWISGLDDGEEPVIVRVDQATGEVTQQLARTGEVFAADTPGDVLLLDGTDLARVSAHDLTHTRSADPLPNGLGRVTHVWDDRGTTVVIGDGTAGGTVVWDLGEDQLRQSQLTEPVVATSATEYVGRIALATADGDIEIIDLISPGPGQLLDARHDAPVRHIRLYPDTQVEVAYADGHTSTHTVSTD